MLSATLFYLHIKFSVPIIIYFHITFPTLKSLLFLIIFTNFSSLASFIGIFVVGMSGTSCFLFSAAVLVEAFLALLGVSSR